MPEYIPTGVIALLVCLAIAANFGKTRAFLRNFFIGPHIYVLVNSTSGLQVYKDPDSRGEFEDKPLESVPDEVLHPENFYVYYNVCWFHCGQLLRCEHATHKTAEDATSCDRSSTPDSFVAQVLEQS